MDNSARSRVGSDPSLEPPDPCAAELEQTVLDFTKIQAEFHFRQAQDLLREFVGKLDLSTREQAGLESEIDGLTAMLDKLEHTVVHIAAFGMVGCGKSSLLNALLGQAVFKTGPTHGVTQTVQRANWQTYWDAVEGSRHEIVRVALPGLGRSRIELIDTPGIDEVDGEHREALARRVARQADLILFVVAGDITQVEHRALSELRQAGKPILLVFNKIDQFPEADRLEIYQKIRDERVRELLSADEIVLAAASPRVARAERQPDGQLTLQLCPGTPQVEDLKLKILAVLEQEGKSLIALNTMLFTADVNEQLIQRKMAIRGHTAEQIIWNAVMTKGMAVALNPVLVMDLLGGVVIDIAMILVLSKLYGMTLSQQDAIALLQKIAIGMGGIGASELLAVLGLSSLKTVLGLVAPATGGLSLGTYVPIALTQASVAGVATYAIGQVTKAYLASGAAWGPEGPKTVISQILDSLDEASILSRIRIELQARLKGTNPNL